MSFVPVAGTSLEFGRYHPEDPLPKGRVVGVPRATVKRLRYLGAMAWTEEYGALALFKDDKTGLVYGQPAGE